MNGGVLDAVNGVISTGKEAVIMHADGGPGPQESEEPLNVPKECAVKVFKTTLNEFKTRDKYIRVGRAASLCITRSWCSGRLQVQGQILQAEPEEGDTHVGGEGDAQSGQDE